LKKENVLQFFHNNLKIKISIFDVNHKDTFRLIVFLRKGLTVFVADDPARAKEAESILKSHGHLNVQSYLAGMKEWDLVGGLIKYPRFVTFTVSFLAT
jgi:hypothetical protein